MCSSDLVTASDGRCLSCQSAQREGVPHFRAFRRTAVVEAGPQTSSRLRASPSCLSTVWGLLGQAGGEQSLACPPWAFPGLCKPPQARASAAKGLPFQQVTLQETSFHHGIKGRRGGICQPNTSNVFALLTGILVS